MIKTILQDQFINIVVGAVFAITAGDKLKSEPLFGKYFRRNLAFSLLVFMPVGIYLAVFYTDWSWMYFIDYREYPLALTIAGVCGYPVSNLIGYFLARHFMAAGNKNGAYAVAGAGLVGLSCLILIPLKRVMYVGSYAEFTAGTAKLMLENIPFTISIVAIGIYFFIPCAILVAKNLKENA